MAKMNISKHGKSRMKERAGISNNASGKIVNRAMNQGIRYEDTLGELHEWILNRRPNSYTKIFIYAGMTYIFKNNTLVTAIEIPEEIKNHLCDFVQKDAWEKYQKYRNSLHRNKSRSNLRFNFVSIDRHTIKAMVNRFCRDNNIPLVAINVTRDYRDRYIVHYISESPDDGKQYLRKIREWGEKERNIKLVLKRRNAI